MKILKPFNKISKTKLKFNIGLFVSVLTYNKYLNIKELNISKNNFEKGTKVLYKREWQKHIKNFINKHVLFRYIVKKMMKYYLFTLTIISIIEGVFIIKGN